MVFWFSLLIFTLYLLNYSMPVNSKAVQYQPDEVNLQELSDAAHTILGRRPFRWQLEATEAILRGEDVILDVGTGSGKSLCFTLPLLLDKNDVSITVSPLTALMKDQVRKFTHQLIFNLVTFAAVQFLWGHQYYSLQGDIGSCRT